MNSSGSIPGAGVHDSRIGVRPVMNLKTDTQISGGNGTKDNPYIVA